MLNENICLCCELARLAIETLQYAVVTWMYFTVDGGEKVRRRHRVTSEFHSSHHCSSHLDVNSLHPSQYLAGLKKDCVDVMMLARCSSAPLTPLPPGTLR